MSQLLTRGRLICSLWIGRLACSVSFFNLRLLIFPSLSSDFSYHELCKYNAHNIKLRCVNSTNTNEAWTTLSCRQVTNEALATLYCRQVTIVPLFYIISTIL